MELREVPKAQPVFFAFVLVSGWSGSPSISIIPLVLFWAVKQMPAHFPFFYRVALLVALMLIVSLAELYRKRTQATKFREYGFILLTGALGAGIGSVNDLITSTISPEYFTLGKGLDEGPGLRLQAMFFGMQEGFSAGVIGGAVCLFAARRKPAHSSVRFSKLFGMLWMPVAGAILGGGAFPVCFSKFDPAKFNAQLNTLLDAEGISRFRLVWWIHLGLYAGLVDRAFGNAVSDCEREENSVADLSD